MHEDKSAEILRRNCLRSNSLQSGMETQISAHEVTLTSIYLQQAKSLSHNLSV